jgi:hypothetical protein
VRDLKGRASLSTDEQALLTGIDDKLNGLLTKQDAEEMFARMTLTIMGEIYMVRKDQATVEMLIRQVVTFLESKPSDPLDELLEDFRSRELELTTDSEGLRRFAYRMRLDDFTGRDHIVDGLMSSLLAEPGPDSPGFLYCCVIGRAGAGKSRLSAEVLKRSRSFWPVNAILPRVGAASVFERLKAGSWIPNRPTFLVIDYASESDERNIKDALVLLSRRQRRFIHPLRLLLLQRGDDAKPADDLLPENFEDSEELKKCQVPPVILQGLDSGPSTEIIRARIKMAGGDPGRFSDDELDQALTRLDANRKPLWAAIVGEQIGKNPEFISKNTSPEETINGILRREHVIWVERAISTYGTEGEELLRKHQRLLALAMMSRGVYFSVAKDTARLIDPEMLPQREKFKYDLYSLISDNGIEDHGDDYWLRPLEPDLLGEGFIDFIFSHVKEKFRERVYERDLVALAWKLDCMGMSIFSRLFNLDLESKRFAPLRFLPKKLPDDPADLEYISKAASLFAITFCDSAVKNFPQFGWKFTPADTGILRDETIQDQDVRSAFRDNAAGVRTGGENDD